MATIDDLVRLSTINARRLDDMEKPEVTPRLAAPLLDLPMLRGAWVGSVDSGGDWYDISGHGHHLSYNGDPEFDYAGLVGYWDYDGTGDWHARTDEADLDITGLETTVASAIRGLTLGGWFWLDSVAGTQVLMAKFGASGQRSYYLAVVAGAPRIIVSVDGTALVTHTFSSTISASAWHRIVGRFVPSTTLDLYVDEAKESLAVGIPASIFNSNVDFRIAARSDGVDLLDGRASACHLNAAALSDAQNSSVFEQQRAAYGV